jgi:predicted nucleic-acid-binding protein
VRAIDTNVVVRFLTNDDRRQARAARAAIEAGDIYIALTVLLEAEWVLRSAYGFKPLRIAESFRGLAGLPTITVEEPLKLARALGWTRRGMDFADALHLTKAEGCTAFLSFDRNLAKVARADGLVPVEEP